MDKQIYTQKNKYKSPAIFIDRDGTINEEIGYLHKIEDWQWCPGAIDSLIKLSKTKYRIIIITNQAGIARGYYSHYDVYKLHSWFYNEIKIRKGRIDAIYFCPHHSQFGELRNCGCRKPKPGMIFQAEKDMNLNLNSSWLIGDKVSDVEAGKKGGLRTILLSCPKTKEFVDNSSYADYSEINLKSAIDFILSAKLAN